MKMKNNGGDILKILTICSSEFLPAYDKRLREHIYFVYDKMSIYLGKDSYSDPFCIVEDIPNKPVDGMLYITFDGFVKARINDQVIIIAEIEDEKQLKLIKNAGNIYFMKAEYRYLDLQNRTIELPYQNGCFHLSVNLAKEVMINENTVIRFDPKQQRFIIDAEMYYPENELPKIKEYSGKETKSAITTVDGTSIRTEVKISGRENNMLEVYNNGLYVNLSDKVSSVDFDKFVSSYNQYKTMLDGYVNELKDVVDSMGENVSETSINKKITDALTSYKPTILDVLQNYETMSSELKKLKTESYTFINDKFDSVENEILDYINNMTSPWEVFPGNEYCPEDNEYLSDTEREVQGMVLEELREQFVRLKPIEAGVNYDVSGDIIFSNERRI